MNSVINCPLCYGVEVSVIDQLDVQSLKRLYLTKFKIQNAINSNSLKYFKCESCALKFFSSVSIPEGLYEELQKFPWYYMEEKAEFNIALKYLPSKGKILEVGAGRGAFAKYVGSERYVGLELSPLGREAAAKIGVDLLNARVEEIARGSQKFSAVVSFQVLEHIENPHQFLAASINCLEVGGKLIISVPYLDGFIGSAVDNVLNLPPHHLSHWGRQTISSLNNFFPLRLNAIELENVSPQHKKWARKIIINHRMRVFLGLNKSILDQSHLSKILLLVSSILARVMPVSLTQVCGHSVVVCYEKTEEIK